MNRSAGVAGMLELRLAGRLDKAPAEKGPPGMSKATASGGVRA